MPPPPPPSRTPLPRPEPGQKGETGKQAGTRDTRVGRKDLPQHGWGGGEEEPTRGSTPPKGREQNPLSCKLLRSCAPNTQPTNRHCPHLLCSVLVQTKG